ncbi:unnamed protein product [Toxocara canis]|uniref:PAP_fibrillin domain-containing protein n=1 Tax=Toxocara canis TaxID=6265 RepID=A0A183U2L5_TOXCA|nr:unnamed protein product [Toxocara canis]
MIKLQSTRWLLLVTITLTFATHIVCSIEADPLEQLVRSVLLTARAFVEKTLSDIPLPRSDTITPEVQYSLQMDDKTSLAIRSLYEFIDVCPICQTVPVSTLVGEWQIIMASRNFLISVIADLSETIDRLEASRPISITKSLNSVFTADPDMQCAKIAIADNKESSPFEFVYTSRRKYRSIVGRILSQRDKYLFEFAPTVAVEFCLMWTTLLIPDGINDALIFSQSDTFPPCSNFVLLARSRDHINVLPFLQYITRNGGNFPFNPMLDISCSYMNSSNGTGS